MINPVYQRELVGVLRTPQALVVQALVAVGCCLLILLRWPTDAQVELSGAHSQQVFRLFAYGLMATVILLVPVFPATSIVHERMRGTLELLLNSPLRPVSIYFGKLLAVLAFVLLLLLISLPAAAACYVMGGVSLWEQLFVLYGLLALAAIQYATLGLVVSSFASSTDSALRITYGLVLLMAVISLGPHLFLQGQAGWLPELAGWLRCLSPLPAVMKLAGHADVGGQGLMQRADVTARFVLLAVVVSTLFAARTILRLNQTMLDRARDQGVITEERGLGGRLLRRMFFLVDPQRRSRGISLLVNPVMIKEFRSRRFGRSHWMMRLIALCVLISLGLTYASSMGSMQWGVETIGGIMILLQVALIVLLTPSLAAGLISTERESGSWVLLQMTPLSVGKIVRGKLLSVCWPLMLILLATLPGYVVMDLIQPQLRPQVVRVLICLGITTVFALLLSAAVGSLFRRSAAATTAAYIALVVICVGPMLIWLGRDAPFGHSAVQAVLVINPLAAALQVMEVPGFRQYNLVPANWWIMGGASLLLAAVLSFQTWRLSRPV